jgi:hypothetical protein
VIATGHRLAELLVPVEQFQTHRVPLEVKLVPR